MDLKYKMNSQSINIYIRIIYSGGSYTIHSIPNRIAVDFISRIFSFVVTKNHSHLVRRSR